MCLAIRRIRAITRKNRNRQAFYYAINGIILWRSIQKIRFGLHLVVGSFIIPAVVW